MFVHNLNSTDGSSVSRNSCYYYYKLLISVQDYRNKSKSGDKYKVRIWAVVSFPLKVKTNVEVHTHHSHLPFIRKVLCSELSCLKVQELATDVTKSENED